MKNFTIASAILAFSTPALSDSLNEIRSEIHHAVPAGIPRLWLDSNGEERINPAWIRAFSNRRTDGAVVDPDLFQKRREMRKIIRSRELPPLSPFRAKPRPNDEAARLVQLPRGERLITNLAEMEKADLTSYSFPQDDSLPWSDTYWPLYQGGLANRYADPDAYPTADWLKNLEGHFPGLQSRLEEVEKSEGRRALYSALQEGIASSNYVAKDLSPAEKYDALIGDQRKTLTAQNWAQGLPYYFSETGDRSVARWMGLCHGWAPAAYSVPRPLRSVRAQGPNGEPIVFRPSDIKGLVTALWANGDFRTRFVGSRCEKEDPERDESGRITDSTCFDNNPATWHQVVTNQLGRAHRSFVMDASFEQEVWNQPLIGYSYEYVELKTWEPVGSLQEALLDRRKKTGRNAFPPSRDIYHSYRPSVSEAPYVVGIAMKVTYGMETHPEDSEELSWEDDFQTTVRYYYDLELDENFEIVGGEWYESKHPDFLWTSVGSATSLWDLKIERDAPALRWDPTSAAPPRAWRDAGLHASRESTPLAHIVEALVRASREP